MTKFALTEDFEQILGHPIRETGRNSMVKCPLHEDRVPSLSLELDKGIFLCFSCGEKGTIAYLAALLDQPFDAAFVALRTFEEPVYIEPIDFVDLATRLHEEAQRSRPREILDYIVQRGLSPRVFQKFLLGWDGKRIAMPYFYGEKVIAVKYRRPSGLKIFEPGSQQFLYNVNDFKGAETIVLCEGESDTHAAWSVMDRTKGAWHSYAVGGVPGVGKGLPSQRTWELWLLEIMNAKRVYIAFDADDAGDAGSILPMSILGDKTIRMRPTKGKDITDHLQNGGTLDELGLV